MSRVGRRLSPDEAELWARVANRVVPLEGASLPPRAQTPDPGPPLRPAVKPRSAHPQPPRAQQVLASAPAGTLDTQGLDAGWDRKLSRGLVGPDYTLDLHGASLDAAHSRLLHGLTQAKAMGARVVLLITGKPRPVEPGDRGHRRGAIRAKVIDWLAASDHALDIAAIRGAHRRHGRPGALYIVLKRRR